MQGKLRCALLDDELIVHETFREYLKNNEYAEITGFYTDPEKLLDSEDKYDLLFIDVCLPGMAMDGFTAAARMHPTPAVMFTGNPDWYEDIFRMINKVDAFAKPIERERLEQCVKNHYFLVVQTREKPKYLLLRTKDGERSILNSHILFVQTIKEHPRHLKLYLSKEKPLEIIGYSIEDILNKASILLQPNRSELVSRKAIAYISKDHSIIHLERIRDEKGKAMISILTESHRKNFLEVYSI